MFSMSFLGRILIVVNVTFLGLFCAWFSSGQKEFVEAKTECSNVLSSSAKLGVSEHAEFILNKHAKIIADLDRKNSSSLIVFACDSSFPCGGLGDRMKGLVTAFVMALVTNSEFMVQWNSPVPLQEFFSLPRTWKLEQDAERRLEYFRSLPIEQKVSMVVLDWWKPEKVHELKNHSFRLLTCRTNLATWMDFLNDEDFSPFSKAYGLDAIGVYGVFRVAARAFFSIPTTPLLAVMQSVKSRLGENRRWVGVHFRQGGENLTGWTDPARHSAAELPFFASDSIQLCGMSPCSILFESDSLSARSSFPSLITSRIGSNLDIRVVCPDYSPFHLDKSIRTSDSGGEMQSLMASWHIFTEMHALVISRSGLSETASWAANVPTIKRNPGDLKSGHISWPE
jgi:hypothetical protein